MISINEAERQVDYLEQVLLGYGIRILPGSPLETACLAIKDWKLKHERAEPADPYFDFREQDRYIVGINFICSKIIAVHNAGRFSPFVGHLRLLATAEPTQTVPHLPDDASNKVFELVVGLCCAELTEDVTMDSPTSSRGDNPDVIADFDGERWGFACKVLHSKNPLTFLDRLTDGVRQLDAADIDTGVVVLNLKNLFDHNSIFQRTEHPDRPPEFKAYKNPAALDEKVSKFCIDVVLSMQKRAGKELVRAIFKSSKTPPTCLTFLQTSAPFMKNGVPVATGLSFAIDIALTGQSLSLPLAKLQMLERRLVARDLVVPADSPIAVATERQLRQQGIHI